VRRQGLWSKLRGANWEAKTGGAHAVSYIEDIGEVINTFRLNNDALISSILLASKKLKESSMYIQRSWSGSCLGWHTNMYFRDFEAPSVYERFSCERGGIDGIPEGWEEKQPEVVQRRIEELVGNSFSIDDFEDSVSKLESKARSLRDEVLITFTSSVESLRDGEQKLLAELENLSLITGRQVYIEQRIPSRVMTHDIEAVNEGRRMPAALYWEGVALEAERIARQVQARKISKPELSDLHPVIAGECYELFSGKHYTEAAERSFKVVRDRLRKLTNYETGSEAFGKGNLHILGAAEPHVDKDFNEGVKFLTMAIDNFRNEKSHSLDAKIADPNRAYHYLVVSSLAMFLLDNAEIKNRS
jgi:uncharacterized protein (TIGR02391 family)